MTFRYTSCVNKIRSAEGQAILALLYTGLILTALEYGLHPPYVEARLQGIPLARNPRPSLEAGLWWAGGSSAAYLLAPLVLTRLLARRPLREVGFSGRGFMRHAGVYLLLYALMLPFLLMAAGQAGFLDTYPFVKSALLGRSRFLAWEVPYLVQFFCLEAFFRGYLLFTLERSIGRLAIFVMAVPYCMIHYHKPALEAFGALGAGVILGFLALRYRSFYGGALLHGLVAVTMDGLAAHRAGVF